MPWMETCPVEERRLRFVEAAASGDWAMAELCRVYGVSRKTGYKWRARYERDGIAGLSDHKRARRTQDHAVADEIRELVVNARRQRPTWGPKKLRPWLERRHPEVVLPSLTTMGSILRDAKLVQPQRRRRCLTGGTGGLGGEDRPNGVWATDFKGEFRLGDRRMCYPLTVTDAHSRYLLACRGLSGTEWIPVKEAFVRLFRQYGVPEQIRSDNGTPFASRGAGRLTQLAAFWIDQGIRLQRITPGRPQENGRHERMHLTLKNETATPPARTMRGQQQRFNGFRGIFNDDRPHEALDQTCPAEHYEPSSRAYDPKPTAAEYPGHYVVRSIRSKGAIKWRGQEIFITTSLVGKPVGLVEIDEDRWRVYYRDHPLGTLDATTSEVRIRPIEGPVSARSLRRRGTATQPPG